jgi:hypothetical protein
VHFATDHVAPAATPVTLARATPVTLARATPVTLARAMLLAGRVSHSGVLLALSRTWPVAATGRRSAVVLGRRLPPAAHLAIGAAGTGLTGTGLTGTGAAVVGVATAGGAFLRRAVVGHVAAVDDRPHQDLVPRRRFSPDPDTVLGNREVTTT